MKTNGKHNHPPARSECPRTRVAESSVAAVDLCACGMMQVHVGPLTLRMAPCAVSELLATLSRAVAEHEARHASVDSATGAIAFGTNGRGEA
jgi:hypothetical protein